MILLEVLFKTYSATKFYTTVHALFLFASLAFVLLPCLKRRLLAVWCRTWRQTHRGENFQLASSEGRAVRMVWEVEEWRRDRAERKRHLHGGLFWLYFSGCCLWLCKPISAGSHLQGSLGTEMYTHTHTHCRTRSHATLCTVFHFEITKDKERRKREESDSER